MIDYYAAKFPDLLDGRLPARLLGVALTDTFARTAVETYAKLADRYDVWLAAGVNMARRWQIVCVDKARFRAAAGRLALRRAGPRAGRPAAQPGRARRATTPTRPRDERFSNMALLFDPNGRLVSRQVKEYLTPIELPGNLDLAPGRGARAVCERCAPRWARWAS